MKGLFHLLHAFNFSQSVVVLHLLELLRGQNGGTSVVSVNFLLVRVLYHFVDICHNRGPRPHL